MLGSIPFLLCACKLVQCQDLHSASLLLVLYCELCVGVHAHKGQCFQSQKQASGSFFSKKKSQKANLQQPCFYSVVVSCWVGPIVFQVT